MSGADLVRVANGIADAIATQDFFEAVYPLPPSSTDAGSATVLPNGGTTDTYCRHELKFDVVLAASVNDFAASIEWLGDGIDAVIAALSTDPSCGGVCDGLAVESWGEFYTTTIGGGADALAVRITLTPTTAQEA